MLKLKLVTWTAVIMVAGVLMADFFFRSPAVKTGLRDENQVTLVVKFTPNRRVVDTAAVNIQVMVGGTRVLKDVVTRSPWERTVQVGSGRELGLLASMAYGTTLECHIRIGKQGVFSNWRDSPGQVLCNHKF